MVRKEELEESWQQVSKIVQRNREIFGLELWTWRITEAKDLSKSNIFYVDMLFRNSDREKVEQLINEYKRGQRQAKRLKKWNPCGELVKGIVKDLSELTIYECPWG